MADYPFFPMFVDISQKHVLVVGAGKIALRRIKTLAQFTPFVTVLSPEVHPELLPLEEAGNIKLIRQSYAPSFLEGMDLVFAATNNPEVNARIRTDAKALGLTVNVSSDRAISDFYFPGIARKDSLVVAVTASGTNHALAKEVSRKMREVLDGL